MSAQTRPSILGRSRSGRLLGLAVVSAVLSTLLVGDALPARADPTVAPKSGSFSVRGSGWGHGWGMSQYGAYGAAERGLDWKQILAFYYPGTTRADLPARSMLKVWVTSDTDGSLRVLPVDGTQRPRRCRRHVHRPHGHEVQVLADQAARLGLPAELPHRRLAVTSSCGPV